MTQYYLTMAYSRLIEFAIFLTQKKNWIAYSVLASLFVSLFLAFPSYDTFFTGQSIELWKPVLEKVQDPLKDMSADYGDSTHASKLTFRMTVPLIAHFLKLNTLGIVILQFIGGIALLLFVILITEKIVKDKIVALFTGLLVGSVYAGSTSFVELRGIFDGIAILFLIIAMYSERPFMIFILLSLSYWTDERAILASLLVLIFHLLRHSKKNRFNWRTLYAPFSVSILMSWIVYLVTRYFMITVFHFSNSTGGVGISVFLNQINQLPMGTWTGLEGGWLIVFFSLIALIAKRDYYYLLFFLVSIAVIATFSLCVVDITRSMAYLLPSIFIALQILAQNDEIGDIRVYCAIAMIISVITASYYAGGEKTIWWQYPLPLQVLRWVAL